MVVGHPPLYNYNELLLELPHPVYNNSGVQIRTPP